MAVFQKSVHFLHHQIYPKSVLVKSLFLYSCVMNECDRDLVTYTTQYTFCWISSSSYNKSTCKKPIENSKFLNYLKITIHLLHQDWRRWMSAVHHIWINFSLYNHFFIAEHYYENKFCLCLWIVITYCHNHPYLCPLSLGACLQSAGIRILVYPSTCPLIPYYLAHQLSRDFVCLLHSCFSLLRLYAMI